MGIFDFVKDAGEKLLEKVTGSFEDKAKVIADAIQGHGLKVENLAVAVDDDLARVSGTAASQEDKEKTVLVAGNVKGIAKVDDQLAVAAAAEEPAAAQFYTVVSGDTLSKIAKEHYGDASKYPVIFEANKPMLKDPDRIYPGQNLRIPPVS
jgi:nucleoid-associated protein YgaU